MMEDGGPSTPRNVGPLGSGGGAGRDEVIAAPRGASLPEAAGATSLHPGATPRAPRLARFVAGVRDFFVGGDISFGIAVVPLCFLSMILFTRHPLKTNFIFDEQEALLANRYVRSVADPHTTVRWIDAFHRDFWGLPAERSIGSYRPIPDLVWRALWAIGARDQTPFLHHWVNVLLHGVNGALVVLMVQRVTRDRVTAWLAGAFFVAAAVLTEAVSGVVGIADVLGGLGALLALTALALPLEWMPAGLFAATLFGLFSKESALCIVPLVPLAALLCAPLVHPARPRRWLRAGLALVATAAAFVLYVEGRKAMFHATLPPEVSIEANAGKPWPARAFAALLRWYAQPALPRDALNNPFVGASLPYRIAGAMRVYLRGLGQVLFPLTLSGDYSAPQEPVPSRLVSPESVIGALAMVGPLVASAWLGIAAARREARRNAESLPPPSSPRFDRAVTLRSPERTLPDMRPVIAAALAWVVVSYLPVSNIPVVLPTVRAERFWYFPAIGTSVLLALGVRRALAAARVHGGAVAWAGRGLVAAFFLFQAAAARAHANDYTDDLVFWDATRHAVPRSAKAHLNYSVMQGARGNLEERARANRVALDLAPTWPMANVYLGDTLCRLHRPAEAWPYYARGFELAPNETSLLALGMQCLWDEHALEPNAVIREHLEALAAAHPGSWLEYLARDTLENGEEHHGVDPKYRPRGYNEGPKSE